MSGTMRSGVGGSSGSMGGASGATAVDETGDLIASDKVEGTPVYNQAGERLGTVRNFMVGKRSGKVAYAVMSFGGFLGIGESYHPLPWEVLTYDTSKGGYVVNLSREQLEGAPRYSGSQEPNWSDPGYGRGINDYYGVPFGGARIHLSFHLTVTEPWRRADDLVRWGDRPA